MSLFSYIIPHPVARFSSPYNKQIDVISWRGQRMLYVDGIQQSGNYTQKLWKRAFDDVVSRKPLVRSVALLGVGGATVVPMVRDAYPGAMMTAVDIDPVIMDIASTYFGLKGKKITTVVSDARLWVSRARRLKKRFDMIIVDLYIGNDVPLFVGESPFLMQVRGILAPRGIVVLNYFSYRDHRVRSGRILDKLSKIYQSVVRKDIFYNTFFICS